jgi:L-2-hydroxyglutarate oxidase
MYDVAIIGGGILGLATALGLQEKQPKLGIVLIEKEDRWAVHQTGHNSGVIHSGIYYRPGSLKARLARAGRDETVRFAKAEGLPFELCGKLIVATDPAELPRLDRLEEFGRANGVTLERLDAKGMTEHEPHVAGITGLYVADTGICDFTAISRRFALIAGSAGADLRTGTTVTRLVETEDEVTLHTDREPIRARKVVVCAGLQSGLLAQRSPARIVPFRGEYYDVGPHGRALIRNLVYPVPDPAFPFLGVHLTRGVDGNVHAGPNAVLALAREGYTRHSISVRDTAGTLSYPGFWKMAAEHWRYGAGEVARSVSTARFVASARRLVPALRRSDLRRGHAGVRAQAVDREGRIIDDFLFAGHGRTLHVLNAPSPAATAALPIGRELAARALA